MTNGKTLLDLAVLRRAAERPSNDRFTDLALGDLIEGLSVAVLLALLDELEAATATAALLPKYMAHVIDAEGISFVDDHHRNPFSDSPSFADEEWATLQAIAEQGKAGGGSKV
ncbi:hypothetical protein IV454_16330 [Massilia antarctica]|uniref:Uncharacterized protein n=1 Tax=Massilia antarctica TaxID=2765360 RepID=A0AA48WIH3_9BURK|nr:hypothetical protein [Massilia antarctica]QPI52913.1 hypothetical protein IV454_16330 [Massilia antarctica]